ncbi:predicted protein [Plenodomus lingam JN3]|uniref:Predicted protein n=1 Tax=Leptosphaeria maculans (strain JN3 / isolate v23.1.3 / race Av1-4-5-6-7-8) TaxID=985895 RepID=E4ZWS4_LEPMJ|nr:predicted protein [Plenodomus lingam JN3]CBX96050.1 predicted protein [Plenodomus lingam JN3]
MIVPQCWEPGGTRHWALLWRRTGRELVGVYVRRYSIQDPRVVCVDLSVYATDIMIHPTVVVWMTHLGPGPTTVNAYTISAAFVNTRPIILKPTHRCWPVLALLDCAPPASQPSKASLVRGRHPTGWLLHHSSLPTALSQWTVTGFGILSLDSVLQVLQIQHPSRSISGRPIACASLQRERPLAIHGRLHPACMRSFSLHQQAASAGRWRLYGPSHASRTSSESRRARTLSFLRATTHIGRVGTCVVWAQPSVAVVMARSAHFQRSGGRFYEPYRWALQVPAEKRITSVDLSWQILPPSHISKSMDWTAPPTTEPPFIEK